jgi:hypothetical protein
MSQFDESKLEGMEDEEAIQYMAEHVDTMPAEYQTVFKSLAGRFASILVKSVEAAEGNQEDVDEKPVTDGDDTDAEQNGGTDKTPTGKTSTDGDGDGDKDEDQKPPSSVRKSGADFSDLHQTWAENDTDVEEFEAAPILNDIAVAIKSLGTRLDYIEEGQNAIQKGLGTLNKSVNAQNEIIKSIGGSVESAAATPSGQASAAAGALLKAIPKAAASANTNKAGVIEKGIAGTEHIEKSTEGQTRFGMDSDQLFKGLFEALNQGDEEVLKKGFNAQQLTNLPALDKTPKWMFEAAARVQNIVLEDE